MNYPKHIVYKDLEIPINWDFRAGIEFERLVYDTNIEDKDRFIRILENYFKSLPTIDEPKILIDNLLTFYRCGKVQQATDENAPKQKQAYDFYEDWPYIHAAFLQQYNMDLNTVNGLHWWQFKGMLESLDDRSQFKKILGFRVMKIDSNMSKEQKKYYSEMKKVYRLPDKRSQEEIDEDFANAFW